MPDKVMNGRGNYVDVDKSGLSMSWRTAAAIVSCLIVGALAWSGFKATLVRSPDLAAHYEDPQAHPAMIKPLSDRVERMDERLISTEQRVESVQDGMYDQRAEDLAYRSVSKMPEDASTEAKIRRFRQVKHRAKQNLKRGLDISDGLDAPVF